MPNTNGNWQFPDLISSSLLWTLNLWICAQFETHIGTSGDIPGNLTPCHGLFILTLIVI